MAAATAAGLLCIGSSEAATQRITVQAGGLSRYYDLYVPDSGENYPLLLAFHGGLASPEQMKRISGLESLAARQGFAVAFMAGTGRRENRLMWNAGGCCAGPMLQNVDELAYVQAAIGQISAGYPIDVRRIYLVGISNGGMLVQVLAERMASQIAGAVDVSGARFRPVSGGPPVPILVIHAKRDPIVPYEGGYSPDRLVVSAMSAPFIPVEEGVASWAKRNGCTTVTQEERSRQTISRHEACAGGTQVTLIALDYDKHGWFGSGGAAGAPVKATSAAWEFLRGFHR